MAQPLSPPRRQARSMPLRAGAGARAWAAGWLAWLLLALVLAPALGRVHQALHSTVHLAAGRTGVVTAHPHRQALHQGLAAPATASEGSDGSAGAALSALVPAHASGADCLLLDQLALADVLLAPPPGLPLAHFTQRAPLAGPQLGFARHRALFQARAPPTALAG